MWKIPKPPLTAHCALPSCAQWAVINGEGGVSNIQPCDPLLQGAKYLYLKRSQRNTETVLKKYENGVKEIRNGLKVIQWT